MPSENWSEYGVFRLLLSRSISPLRVPDATSDASRLGSVNRAGSQLTHCPGWSAPARLGEAQRVGRQCRLDLFQAHVVVEVAVVAAADAAEDHVPLVAVEVVGETEARREVVAVRAAVVAVADVLVDVDPAQRELGVGLARRRGRVVAVQQGIHHLGRGDVVDVGRDFLPVPAHADVELQLVVDVPVVLDVQADLLVLGGHRRVAPENGRLNFTSYGVVEVPIGVYGVIGWLPSLTSSRTTD